jgi:hypothetical protein
LSNQTEDGEAETEVGSPEAEWRGEWELVGGAALDLDPSVTETDVGEADGSPGEEVGETGQGQEPVEDGQTLWCQGDVGKETENQGEDEGRVWATVLVNLGEDLWAHTLLAKSLKGSGGSVCAGVGDRDDGEGDDGVEDGREGLDVGEVEGQDEWRVLGVCAGSSREGLVIGWDNGTEDEEGDDVEEGDTPEDLLGSLWDGLSWVIRLGGGETDQLSSSESEGCSNEDGAETLEAVLEGSWVVPVLESEVATVIGWDTTAVDDDTKDDETNDSDNLDRAENELNLSVTLDTENVDNGDQDEEDGDPDGVVDASVGPVINGDTGGDEFERQDNKPVDSVVPTHSKTPGRIDEADRVVVERAVDRVAGEGCLLAGYSHICPSVPLTLSHAHWTCEANWAEGKQKLTEWRVHRGR